MSCVAMMSLFFLSLSPFDCVPGTHRMRKTTSNGISIKWRQGLDVVCLAMNAKGELEESVSKRQKTDRQKEKKETNRHFEAPRDCCPYGSMTQCLA